MVQVPSNLLALLTFGTVVLIFCWSGLMSFKQLRDERILTSIMYANDTTRRLKYLDGPRRGNDVFVHTLPDGHFHLFLSHVWSTAQDQMRQTKDRLLELIPKVKVFLDVYDLTEGRGAESVDLSEHILVMISEGYFTSKNCTRELLRAVWDEKPIITMLESDRKKGAMTYERSACSCRRSRAGFRSGAWTVSCYRGATRTSRPTNK